MSEVTNEIATGGNKSVAAYVEKNPVSVLVDDGLRERFFAEIEKEIDEFVPVLETAKGRKAITALAQRYVKTKTAIDAAGKAMNEEARARIDAVDAARRDARTKLDAMRDRARKPLDDWEAAEEARKLRIDTAKKLFENCRIILATDTSADIMARIELATACDVVELTDEKESVLNFLTAAHVRLIKDELDREELAKLRAAEDERLRVEAEKAAQRRDYCRSIIQHIHDCGNGIIGGKPYPYGILFRELEEKVVIDESFGELKEEAELARASAIEKLQAGQKAQAEREAREEQAEKDRIAAAERKAAQDAVAKAEAEAAKKAADAKAAADAEIKRLADQKKALEDAENARKAAEAKAVAEADARAKDRAHRSAIMGAAKTAIIEVSGISEDLAKAIVLAITKGEIPNVSIVF